MSKAMAKGGRGAAARWAALATWALAACTNATGGGSNGGTDAALTDAPGALDSVTATDTAGQEDGAARGTETAAVGLDAAAETAAPADTALPDAVPDVAPVEDSGLLADADAPGDVAADSAAPDVATVELTGDADVASPADAADETLPAGDAWVDAAAGDAESGDIATQDATANTDAAADSQASGGETAASDTGPADAGSVDAGSADVPPNDAGIDVGPTCPGAAGCACKSGSDCSSGECGSDLQGKPVCVDVCAANGTCAKGFACAKGAGKSLCLPQDIALCAPCLSNDNCAQTSAAGKAGACVDFAADGAFCGYACAANADCPEGYGCADSKDVTGAAGKFCKPLNGALCTCSPAAIAAGAGTMCSNGACTAPRKCTAAGLEPCAAKAPSPDICDGLDNDCDGKVDGGANCDDKNACTADACKDANCVATPVADGGKCDDGDACTTDACKQGKCVGNAGSCDDGNPCTKDSCDSKGGCLHSNDDSQPCSDNKPCTKDICKVGVCISDNGACDDGNACTSDACDAAKGCVNLPKPASACDDGDGCTTDTCDPAKGCAHAAIANCQPGLLYKTEFACGATDWKLSPPVANTTAAWAIDATPAKPGFQSPACSLNFNNGSNYACIDTTISGYANGYAVSPLIDASGLKAGADVKVKFALAGAWESGTWDNLTLESSKDGGASWTKIGDYDAPANLAFAPVTAVIAGGGGSKLQLRFGFSVVDCVANDTVGAFIDDMVVVDASCKADKDCDDLNPCTTDSCNATTAACLSTNNTATCNDNDPCSGPDVCGGGKCSGAPASGAKCDDNEPCTADDVCSKGLCAGTPLMTGACDDGDACTSNDACAEGFCSGTAKSCDDKNSCTVDSCDPKTGACANTPAVDGASCSDGDGCSKFDHCENAKCVAQPACDDKNPCTDDKCAPSSPTTANCSVALVADGALCSDGDPCTAADTCAAGKCVGTAGPCSVAVSTAIDCTQAAQWQIAPLPQSATEVGWAVDATPQPPAFKSAPCSLNFNNGTNFACAAGDKKVAGTAVWAPAIDLGKAKQAAVKFWSYGDTYSDNLTDQRWVEASTDDFKTVAKSWKLDNGSAQNKVWQYLTFDLTPLAGKVVKLRMRFDSLNCTLNGYAGWFVDDLVVVTDIAKGCTADGDCGDSNACTTDKCTNGACVFAAATGSACDDGNPCTAGENCSAAAVCVGGAAVTCNDNNPCTTDTCNVLSGCKYVALVDGSVCSDNNACTAGDSCKGGVCSGAKPVVCDDGDKCTTDGCDLAKGCTASYIEGCADVKVPYSNKFDCNDPMTGWSFTNLTAGPKWAVDAKPNPPGFLSPACSLNYNDDTNYVCPTGATKLNGTALSPVFDATGYTGSKLHVRFFYAGAWESGTYDNLDVAILPVNSTATALTSTYDGSSYFKPVVIDVSKFIGQHFRVSFSFNTSDCVLNSTVGAFVDDLTVGDATCKQDSDCNDSNPCSIDTCAVATGQCSYAASTGNCDDGNACTVGDKCGSFLCSGSAKICNDGEDCTTDTCDAQTGACKAAAKADATACTDGNACTTGDVCTAGKCAPTGTAADGGSCSDNDACTTGDACKAGKCAPTGTAADGTTCSDNNPCTSGDVCKTGKCAGPASACDDKDPCTADSCSVNGTLAVCSFAAVPEGQACDDGQPCTDGDKCTKGLCKPTALLCAYGINEGFEACGATQGWTLDPVGSNKVGWAFDGTPNPPAAFAGNCSLNINDGTGYAGTGGTSAGKALSPEIDLTNAKVAMLTFWSFSGVQENSFDKRTVEVLAGATVLQSIALTTAADLNKWALVSVDLKAHIGKKIRLRFAFDTQDGIANSGPGWFVDNLLLQTGLPPTVYKVATSGFTFAPATLQIAAGDIVEFSLGAGHNAVEVEAANWDANTPDPLAGGFSVGFGETKKVTFAKPGTYYYMCQPHGFLGMKGQIVVK